MNFDVVKQIADAVLYEGYILYPYRASAVKNRQRFNFGTVYPQIYSALGGGAEPWKMRTECLVVGRRPQVELRIRFLQLRSRDVWRLTAPAAEGEADGELPHEAVASLQIGEQLFSSWQEATEREVTLPGVDLLAIDARRHPFSFPAAEDREPLRDSTAEVIALLVRRQSALHGALEIACSEIAPQVFKLGVTIENHTSFDAAASRSHDDVLLHSFVSTHTVLGTTDGEFVSLLDPPAELKDAVAQCHNLGTWPVLAGSDGDRSMLLSSPIILYDYPQVAPESSGDFFDGTEIDEMLALRIMTMTPGEQREMREVDVRARQLLERVENLPQEHLLQLHGAMRGLKESHR